MAMTNAERQRRFRDRRRLLRDPLSQIGKMGPFFPGCSCLSPAPSAGVFFPSFRLPVVSARQVPVLVTRALFLTCEEFPSFCTFLGSSFRGSSPC